MMETMEEYREKREDQTGQRLGFAAIGLYAVFVIAMTLSVGEGDVFGMFAVAFLMFGWGYLACYLIHKSRIAILKRETKKLILHYHNYGQPNTPQQAVYRPQEVQVMAPAQQSDNLGSLIKYIEKL